MGLDQYAHSVDENGEKTEIAYWRKHNRLQGWMEKQWRDLGGEGDFNCEELELSPADIDVLEDAVMAARLPQTEGFFFGQDSYEDQRWSADYRKQDVEFIEAARAALRAGHRVLYYCWW